MGPTTEQLLLRSRSQIGKPEIGAQLLRGNIVIMFLGKASCKEVVNNVAGAMLIAPYNLGKLTNQILISHAKLSCHQKQSGSR